MFCPCCGIRIENCAGECECGARFIGKPLSFRPFNVVSYGPVLMAVSALLIVPALSILFTKWLIISTLIPAWLSHHAYKKTVLLPDKFGGRRVAAITFVVTLTLGLSAAIYGISYIPRTIENISLREAAATKAAFYHLQSLAEEYKSKHGQYPSELVLKRESPLPSDSWGKSIQYQSYTEAIANATVGLSGARGSGIQITNFEIRSAGPDGIQGTSDDIVMRDGVFITDPEIINQVSPMVQKRR